LRFGGRSANPRIADRSVTELTRELRDAQRGTLDSSEQARRFELIAKVRDTHSAFLGTFFFQPRCRQDGSPKLAQGCTVPHINPAIPCRWRSCRPIWRQLGECCPRSRGPARGRCLCWRWSTSFRCASFLRGNHRPDDNTVLVVHSGIWSSTEGSCQCASPVCVLLLTVVAACECLVLHTNGSSIADGAT
jgi:hypothetical protein